MIDQEVLDIFDDPNDDGSRINRIADEFRTGRDTRELVVLLDSENPELASIGAWIIGEIAFELYDSEEMLLRLRELTDHPDALVRFHAFGAIFPFLQRDKVLAEEMISKMRKDPEKGNRLGAESAAKRLGL